jgi:O-antigen ligase
MSSPAVTRGATDTTTRTAPAPVAGKPALRPLLVVGLCVAAAIALALGNPTQPEIGVLLGLTFGSSLLILNNAAWAMAPLLISELSIGSYFVPQLGLSLRLAAVLIALVGTATVVLRSSAISDPRFKRVFLPSVVLLILATSIDFLTSGSDYATKYLRYQIVQLLALAVTAAVIRERRDILRIAAVALPITLAAALIALWQHVAHGSALAADLVGLWKGRSVGLSGSPVLLANQLAFPVVPVLGLLATGPWKRDRLRLALCVIAGLLTIGLYLTYTRSALLALGPGILAIGLCLRGRRQKLIIGGIVGAYLAFQLLAGTGLIGARYYETAATDTSAASHQSLLDVALKIAFDHPLVGIGHEHFEEVSLQYLDEVPTSNGEEAIGNERPHNDFLTVWISWGIGALIVYVALFLGTVRNYWIATRSPDLLIRGLAIGCIGGLATYATNSAFHNYLDSSALLWVYAGGSVALARMAEGRFRS